MSLFLYAITSLCATSTAFAIVFSDGSPLSPSSLSPRVGVIFNSSSSIQHKLYLAAWMAFRDTIPDEDEPGSDKLPARPHILDVFNGDNFQDAATWLLGNQTQSVVSLLGPESLAAFLDTYEQTFKKLSQTIAGGDGKLVQIEPLLVVLPRECVQVQGHDDTSIGPFRVKCLQLNHQAIAVALIHRAAKLGVTRLLPVSLRSNSNRAGTNEMYRIYKRALHQYRHAEVSNTPLRLAPTAFGLEQLSVEIRIQNKIAALGYANGTNAEVLGVLILDREPESLEQVLETVTNVHDGPTRLIYTFTPWGVDAMLDDKLSLAPYLKELPYVNRLYTVVSAGARYKNIESRRPGRMRSQILRELNEFIGPNSGPLILTAVAAYDAAVDIVRDQTTGGETLDVDHGTGTFYGVSPKPAAALAASDGFLAQPSDFILEDVQEIAQRDVWTFYVAKYTVGTTSVLSRHDLTSLAEAAEVRINCTQALLQVTSYDPFNIQPYVYKFGTMPESLPLPMYLLIPNAVGYGLELECVHQDQESLVTNLRIACTPSAGGDSVNCYRSNWNHRVKRSEMVQRDDHGYGNGYGSPMDMLMDYMTDTTPAPAPMSSPSPPSPHTTHKPGPPPPDLRTVIKAAKPFVWGCVGSSLGCAMCVLVLGRLPALGPSPATCAGPCFTGVYGQCGALLGRVESETTIICTELFRQGYLDVETFMADAEFGRQMAETAPVTVRGYRVLATPVVYVMRASPVVTKLVAYAAKPWAKYMKSLAGQSRSLGGLGATFDSESDSDWVGGWIHAVGVPICTAVGHLAAGSDQAKWWTVLTLTLGGVFGFILARRPKS